MAKISGVHIPAELKNLAINGALDFWQRVEGSTITVNTTSSTNTYAADMFKYQSGGTTNKNYSIVRSTNVPSQAQSGFNSTYSALFTMLTGISSPASGDYVIPFVYNMEGLDYERIHSKTVTFGFWFKASVAGTYSFALQNSGSTRSYVTTFTVSGASTWEYKTIAVTLDSSGSWNFDNTIGLSVYIGGVTGSTYSTSTLSQWQTANVVFASTATNWQATTNATVQIAQFSIVEGSLGLGATGFLRAGKTIQQELALCQRYYEKSYPIGVAPGTSSNRQTAYSVRATIANHYMPIIYTVSKRIAVGLTFYNSSTGATGTWRDETASVDRSIGGDGTSTGGAMGQGSGWVSGNQMTGHWTADAGL